MAHKTLCDICGTELHFRENFDVNKPHGSADYCKKCWYDKKNWKEIHEKSASDMDD